MNIIKYSILVFLILPLYAQVDYNSDIQPIFNNKCISCHIDGGTYFGGLDLSSYSEVMEGGNSGNTIVPFDHENSLLWQYVNSGYMPAYGSGVDPLTADQINLIAQWIDEGALLESNEIEGRWLPGGFGNTMYEFADGLRYTYYCNDYNNVCDSTYWNSLDISNAIPNPNPYTIDGNTISINLFYGTIATYTIDFRCNGQVVDFYYDENDDWEGLHSSMFRESFDYINSECNICSIYNEEYCSWLPGCQWDYDLDVCFENSNECSLTTDDILGPYYFEDAPFRSVIANENEPGQRLVISGTVKQNDCEDSISGSLIELWQANDEGCYGIVEDCNTGNPENDYFNLRGKFFSDVNGDYTFESILPGYYGSRPRHIHIKITTPNEEVLISQLYFENDPFCENDLFCQDADDRIISLEENEFGLYGSMNLIMDSFEDGIILGDLNNDEGLNIQDIILLVNIIIENFISTDFQLYSGDLNYDYNLDILDIIQLVNIILNN
ncbi:MAG: hypothetical protein P8L91_07835 [Candidatus Marinimicrobia bacterium]|nr:hypothetical protein [Candidatus Neomarinimicrobiota bacterium]